MEGVILAAAEWVPISVAVAVLAVAAGLLVWWVAATRRHLRSRAPRGVDWDGDDVRADLWTSAARCPQCESVGGLLERDDGGLWFECLACGRRHRRTTKA